MEDSRPAVRTTKSVQLDEPAPNVDSGEVQAAALLGGLAGAALFGFTGLVAGGTVAAAAYIMDRTRQTGEDEAT